MLKEESYLSNGKNGIENVKSNSINLFSNRQSKATTERLEHYRYDAESGRLRQRIPDRAYEYDAGGRTTEDGRWRYRYGAHGRLAEITRAATGQRQAAYRYNALGERVKKLSASVTYYHYDLEGRLLAETDASGQTRAEYLYLENEPLALSRSGQIYYYHNDHLGTPRKLTDGDGQVVWSASYRAFGEASIGAGYVTQNLRFPGQYYDEESGLHYNYQRYYDPGTGRYITSDPIGLAGGMNTYGYALQNPLRFVDPTGETAAAAALCFIPGVGWVSCAGAASVIAATVWWAVNSTGEGSGSRIGERSREQCEPEDDDQEELCDKQYYDVDIPTCRGISRSRGSAAAQRCYASAAERYAACLAGRPMPPLDVYNN